MSFQQPTIAIIGGGPGGLTLAALLHKHALNFTLYDLRSRPTPDEMAKVSGSLDMHEEAGLAAIEALGITAEFMALTGECSEATRIANHNADILYAEDEEEAPSEEPSNLPSRPEISRNNLTTLLLSQIPAESFKWNHKLISAATSSTTNTRKVTLDFGPENGIHQFDIVIGADGAWSKIRSTLLTPVKPIYAGVQFTTLTIPHFSSNYPDQALLTGSGTFMALGKSRGIVVQRGAHDSARIYAVVSTDDEQWAKTTEIEGKPASEAKTVLLAAFSEYSASLQSLISSACDEESLMNPGLPVECRPMYALPIGMTWDRLPGVTLLGDAAHLMLPSGEGVNLAMRDALELSQLLSGICKAELTAGDAFDAELDSKLAAYESTILERGKSEAVQSKMMNDMMYGENGGEEFANWFKSVMAAAMEAAGGASAGGAGGAGGADSDRVSEE
ncbi:salicylate hydroxylase [Chytriomyces cf. hyalinus JEL632]|nr:salicylate hydroxylase [Chytriomyces cf. hyalinus JEL632]